MSFQEPMRVWPSLAPYVKEIFLKQADLRVHIYDAGPQDAPTLLLVHGLGDESDTWRHIIHPLAVHQRVIAPDLPGFGRSEPMQRYTIPGIIDVLIELLDTLHISNATLFGSSLGGMLCHSIAAMNPDRVRGLVLLDGHLGISKQKLNLTTLLFLIPGIGEWRYSHYRNNPQAAYESLRPFYANLDNLPIADREFLYQRVNERVWSNRQRKAYLSTMRNTASWMVKHQTNLTKSLKNLTIPTLVIYGKEDKIMSSENASDLAKLQSDIDIMLFTGVGHLPHQENADKLLLALKNDSRLHINL